MYYLLETETKLVLLKFWNILMVSTGRFVNLTESDDIVAETKKKEKIIIHMLLSYKYSFKKSKTFKTI